MDDVEIHSNYFQEHITHVDEILTTVYGAGFTP